MKKHVRKCENLKQVCASAPQWARDAAAVEIERILKPTRTSGMHVMELVKKAKRQAEPNLWRQFVVGLIKFDERIVTVNDQKGTRFVAAASHESSTHRRPSPLPLSPGGVSLAASSSSTQPPAAARPLSSSLPISPDASTSSPVVPQLCYAQIVSDDESAAEPPPADIHDAPVDATLSDALSAYFMTSQSAAPPRHGVSLGDAAALQSFTEAALFGSLLTASGENVFLNTHEPFCLAAVGVQGAGKSHTMSVVLESCLLPLPLPCGQEIVRLQRPMASLVLHYDQNAASVCEATGLIRPSPLLARLFEASGSPLPALPREQMVILVSPSYYAQRRAFYGDYCVVKPLLFRWSSPTWIQ